MRIGYACMTVGVENANLSRCILKNATTQNIKKVININLDALESMIDYNIKNKIKLFRISSDIVPFANHDVNKLNWKGEFSQRFKQIGYKICKNNIKVSMHPGQYSVLNSPNKNVVENTIKDLVYHCDILELLEQDSKSKIVLHIGGVYNDKEVAMKSFITNFRKLPDEVKNRLVIENDDKNFTVEDVLKISDEIDIPVVFDNLHNELNPSGIEIEENNLIEMCGKTWSLQDGRQKIHYSQQKQGSAKGAHSGSIKIDEFLKFYKKIKTKELDIMIEVKDKNLSTIKCINVALMNSTGTCLEKEWSRYKYYVLSRSAKTYNDIRELLKNKDEIIGLDFYKKIESTQKMVEESGAQINAAEHIWGYLNKLATQRDKKRYNKLISEYKEGTGKIKLVKNHLLKLANIQNEKYIIDSLYFYI